MWNILLVMIMLVTRSSVNAQTSGCVKQVYYAQIHTQSGLVVHKQATSN
jgi:hypothetical protein